jgi:hypothetical protein
MDMRRKDLAQVARIVPWLVPSLVFGQLGTVWVNFNGQAVNHYPDPNTNTPPTTFNAFTLQQGTNSLFGTLTDAANLANVKTALVAHLNTDYAGTGTTFTLVQPGAGNYHTLVIGNPNGGDPTNLYGQVDFIDFRHKTLTHAVGVSVTAHANHAAPGGGWTEAAVAQVIANTASHELGHSFGLVHSDVISTFTDTAGAVGAKQTAVQGAEQMVKNPDNTNFFADLSFGRYSKLKLDISSGGVNVEIEDTTTAFKTAAQADPARAGDAGATVAAGTALNVDAKKRVTVLGNFGANDTDVFTFNGTTGQVVTGEAFSITLSQRIADTVDMFNIDLIDSLGNVFATAGPGSSNINAGEFDGTSGIDTDTESRSLLFEFTLPKNDTWGFRLTGQGGDATGDYEFLAIVPEPATLSMALALLIAAPIRRKRT